MDLEFKDLDSHPISACFLPSLDSAYTLSTRLVAGLRLSSLGMHSRVLVNQGQGASLAVLSCSQDRASSILLPVWLCSLNSDSCESPLRCLLIWPSGSSGSSLRYYLCGHCALLGGWFPWCLDFLWVYALRQLFPCEAWKEGHPEIENSEIHWDQGVLE